MAWIDYFKRTVEQLTMLLAGTTEGGTALPGRDTAGDFQVDVKSVTGATVAIDQTTPGTTNAVDLKTVASVTPQLDDTDKLAVSIYGKYAAAGDKPLMTDGSGYLAVDIKTAGAAAADGVSNSLNIAYGQAGAAVFLHALGMLFNGSTWDRPRSNEAATLLASAARTATVSSSDQTNYNGRGVKVFVNVTAVADTPSVTVAIETKDPVSGTYTALLTSAAITGAGHTILTVYPGITVAANVSAANVLGRTWRVTVTHSDTDSITYSVGACTIL